ncbi:MAG: hypothetical protein ACRDTR_20855 [Rubrobacter sp.]
MHQTGARFGDESRLVLGFDAGCHTCSELAKRIEERVGDRVEIRSLNDPVMDHWRKEALGDDAPWAPTLVEVEGGKVQAWTGVRMGVRLSRALGPVTTWRVMQVLGEANADLRLADSTPVRAVSGLTRGQFLKGVGGAAVAISVLSGTGKLPSPAEATLSIRYEEIRGNELVSLARRMAGRKDILNVMGATWLNKVRNGRIIDAGEDGKTIKAIDLGNGRVSSANGKFTFSGELTVIKAAKHTLPHGNSMIAISYAMPKTNRLVAYFEYERPTILPKDQAETKTEALLYRQEREELILEKASSNRQSQILLQEGNLSPPAANSRPSCLPDRRCSNPCDTAYGYSSCHRLKSIGCVAYQCRACAVSCFGGVLLCAACALVVCTIGVIRECCEGGRGCKRCGWCH